MSVIGSGIMRNASASSAPSISKEMSSGMESISTGIQNAQSSAGVGGIKTAVEAFSAEKMGSMQTIQSAQMTSIASVANFPRPTAQLKQAPNNAKYQKVLQHMENPKFQISKGLQSFAQMKLSSQIAQMPIPVPKPADPPPAGPGGIPTPYSSKTNTGFEPGRLEYPNLTFHLPEGRRMIDAEAFSNIAQTLMRTESSALNLVQMSDALNQAAINGGAGNDYSRISGGSGSDSTSIKGGSGNDNINIRGGSGNDN